MKALRSSRDWNEKCILIQNKSNTKELISCVSLYCTSEMNPINLFSSAASKGQMNEDQRRPATKQGGPAARPGPLPSKSPSVPTKLGVKPGALSTKTVPGDGRSDNDNGSRLTPGADDRSRKPGRGIPVR